jgi:hypothetical protein
MAEVFFVNWPPDDAARVAELIARKAGEARKLGAGAEVMLRFVTDAERGTSTTTAAVIEPHVCVVISDATGGK